MTTISVLFLDFAARQSNHDQWSKTTRSCSAWPGVIIYLSCCHAPVMTDCTTAGGRKPDIMQPATQSCEMNPTLVSQSVCGHYEFGERFDHLPQVVLSREHAITEVSCEPNE